MEGKSYFKISVIDPGKKNLCLVNFNIGFNEKKELCYYISEIYKKESIEDEDLCNIINDSSLVLIEHQPFGSKLNLLVKFLEGYSFAKKINFKKIQLRGYGSSYELRKANSVKRLKAIAPPLFAIIEKNFKKLDDFADAVNMGEYYISKNFKKSIFLQNENVKIIT